MPLDPSTSQRDGDALSVLARMQPEDLTAMAERLLPQLGDVEVIQSRSGLVMLPMRDTVEGTDFHLGEVLVAEAHIRLRQTGDEGYGMVLGHDLERAMAMAILDVALFTGIEAETLQSFVADAAARLQQADDEALRDIAATRVDMGSF